MSTVSSTYSSSSRVTGMYSGLDIDSLVESMTSAQQTKIDTQEQKKTTYEWYTEAVNDVLDAVSEFSSTYCSALGSASMLKGATYSVYNVTDGSSNSGAVTISAGSTASAGDVAVRVLQLAKNATVSSSGKVSADGTGISSSNTTVLGNLSFSTALQFNSSGNISFSINGSTFTFSKDTTLQSMINTVNNDETAGVTLTYSRLTDTFSLTADSGGEDSEIAIQNISGNAFGSSGAFQIAEGTVSNGQNAIVDINGTAVEQDSNNFTIDGITYQLNAVTASSDSMVVQQLATAAKVTGTTGVLSSGSPSSDSALETLMDTALTDLDLSTKLLFEDDGEISFSINGETFTFYNYSRDTDGDGTVDAAPSTLQDMLDAVNNSDAGVTMSYSTLKNAFVLTSNETGADSEITVESLKGNAMGYKSAFGISAGTLATGQNSIAVIDGVTVERSSNSYTIDGETYNLTEVTDNTDEYETFSVSRDYSSTVEAVQTFVDAINTLITKLNTLYSEDDLSSDYEPLTDAQKEEMTEEQIEAWEIKAKSGILRNDSNLRSLINGLKNAFYSIAGGTGSNATSIGITTGGYFDDNKGLLVLDTEALTTALEEDPDKVISMFTGGSSTVTGATQGIVYKIKSSLTSYQTSSAELLESTDEKIDKLDDRIDDLNDKLSALAEKYYDRFSVMETALAKLNSQASYISQLFSS